MPSLRGWHLTIMARRITTPIIYLNPYGIQEIIFPPAGHIYIGPIRH